MSGNDYILVTPCRNEAEYMRLTLDSVLAQSVMPALWIIVDDGSTDETPNILSDYASRHALIKIVTRKDRGHRKVGPGVIDAFYAGLETIDLEQFDFLCKLDLDLILPGHYFETLMKRMQENPRIGTCSGKLYYVSKKTNGFVSEQCGDENSIGPTKFYRRQCFEQIGGFVHEVMWDGIDGHRCRQLGWMALSWDEIDLRVTHLRPMGSSQNSIITGRLRHGYGQYYMGTSLIYMISSAIYRMSQRPYAIGGLAMLWGYVRSIFKGLPTFEDHALSEFIRKYQWACLIKGKVRATRDLNRAQEKHWKGF